MRAVLVDSGPLIALFDGSDQHHQRCTTWLAGHQGTLVTTMAVLTETSHLLYRRIGIDGATAFVEWAGRALDVDADSANDCVRIAAIMRQYRDLPADFADASLVALADRRALYDVATIDSDFTIYRGAVKRRFVNRLT